MKKFLIGIFALVLCLGMNSCKKETPAEGAKDADAATETKAAVDEAAPSLADILEKAKAEGANWSVDEWKEQFKNALLAVKPVMLEMEEATKQMKDDPSKAMDLLKKIEEIKAKYPDFDKQMEEFNKIAESCPNGKAVVDDEEWGQQITKELGIPDM